MLLGYGVSLIEPKKRDQYCKIKCGLWVRTLTSGCGLLTKLCPTLVTTWTVALPGSSVHGISQTRLLEWLVISFCRDTYCCCEVTSVVSNSVRLHRRQPTRLPHPWDSPGKNTGVGCHFLLQCMNVKSESEVTQWCLTLSNPMDYSLPGSSIHGVFQARVLEWGAIAFSEGHI